MIFILVFKVIIDIFAIRLINILFIIKIRKKVNF